MMSLREPRARARLAKILLVALLAAPALLVLPSKHDEGENRHLAPFPSAPDSPAAALRYTGAFDAWANDHFGLRARLVALHTKLDYALWRQFPTHQVIAGRHGRIFTAAFQAEAPPYSGILSVCGYQATQAPMLAQQIDRFVAQTRARGLDAKLLVVPTSPVVNMEQLPRWLYGLCRDSVTPMSQVLAGPLAPEVRRQLSYPLAAMREANAREPLFPSTYFHWAGAGPRLVSAWTVQQFWGATPQQATPYVSKVERQPSDISHLFHGLKLESDVETLDWQKSGLELCYGATCFDGPLRPVVEKLREAIRVTNPRGQRQRLVIISDSYGPPAVGWFARYYKEVLLFNTNFLGTLDAADQQLLRSFLFEHRAGDDMLVLYHDATVYAGRLGNDFKTLMP